MEQNSRARVLASYTYKLGIYDRVMWASPRLKDKDASPRSKLFRSKVCRKPLVCVVQWYCSAGGVVSYLRRWRIQRTTEDRSCLRRRCGPQFHYGILAWNLKGDSFRRTAICKKGPSSGSMAVSGVCVLSTLFELIRKYDRR